MKKSDIQLMSYDMLQATENNQQSNIAKEKFVKEGIDFWGKDKANRNLFDQLNTKIISYHEELKLITGKIRANVLETPAVITYSGPNPTDINYIPNSASDTYPYENDPYALNKAVSRRDNYWRLLYRSPDRDSYPYLVVTNSTSSNHFEHNEPFWPRWLNGWFLSYIGYEFDTAQQRWNWRYYWTRDQLNPSLSTIATYLNQILTTRIHLLEMFSLAKNGKELSSPFSSANNVFLSYTVTGTTVTAQSNFNTLAGGRFVFTDSSYPSSPNYLAWVQFNNPIETVPPYNYTGTIQFGLNAGTIPSNVSHLRVSNQFPALTETERLASYNGNIIHNGVNYIKAKHALIAYLDILMNQFRSAITAHKTVIQNLLAIYNQRDITEIYGGSTTINQLTDLKSFEEDTGYMSLDSRYNNAHIDSNINRLNYFTGSQSPSNFESSIVSALGHAHCLSDNISSGTYSGLYGLRFKILAQRAHKYFGSLSLFAKHIENKSILEANQQNNNNKQLTYSDYLHVSLIRGMRTVNRNIIYIEDDKKSQFIGQSNIYAVSDDTVNGEKLFFNVGTVSLVNPLETKMFAVGIETSNTSILGVKNIEKLFVKVQLDNPIPNGYGSGTDGKLRLVRVLPSALPIEND